MNNLLIRNVTNKDFESLSKLYELFWNESQDIKRMEIVFEDIVKNQNYIILCAEIVGTIMGIICYELYGDCKPFIIMDDLIVDPLFRKMNIGKTLMNELENIGKQNHCSQMMFITESSRQDAINFYEKVGYNSKTHVGFKKKI